MGIKSTSSTLNATAIEYSILTNWNVDGLIIGINELSEHEWTLYVKRLIWTTSCADVNDVTCEPCACLSCLCPISSSNCNGTR